jgi:hypothetical protein
MTRETGTRFTVAAHPDPSVRSYARWRMLATIDLHGCDRGRLVAMTHFVDGRPLRVHQR